LTNQNKVKKTIYFHRAAKLDEITNAKEVKFWKKRAIKQIEKNNVKLNSLLSELAYDHVKVYRIADSPYISVGIPIVSPNHHEVSNVAIHFNEKTKKLVTYTELEFMRSDKNTFQIRLAVDNKVQVNKITNDKFTTEEELRESQSNGMTTMSIDWDGVGDCLGISGIAARWLSYICGVTCVITLGTACVACVAGAIGITGGSALACLSDNWN